MNANLVVGIDMAKKDFAVAIRIRKQEKPLDKLNNETSGFSKLSEQLKEQCQCEGLTQIHLIVEATGGYEAALVAYAYKSGWLVSMPNPKQVRDWAKGESGSDQRS